MNDYPEDSYGNQIAIDDTVAFNKSGKVVRGTVVNIKRRTDGVARRHSWNCVQWVIEIESDGAVSKVKNTDGILVLY